MAQFEMHIMITQKNRGNFESSEYKLMCWIKNTEDLHKVQSVAEDILFKKVCKENSKREILFGNANIFVSGEEVITIGLKNENANSDDVTKVLDLFDFNEETVH